MIAHPRRGTGNCNKDLSHLGPGLTRPSFERCMGGGFKMFMQHWQSLELFLVHATPGAGSDKTLHLFWDTRSPQCPGHSVGAHLQHGVLRDWWEGGHCAGELRSGAEHSGCWCCLLLRQERPLQSFGRDRPSRRSPRWPQDTSRRNLKAAPPSQWLAGSAHDDTSHLGHSLAHGGPQQDTVS